MPTLLECLNRTSYRHLHAIARAHYLPHPQRHPPKEVWVATLHHFLLQPDTLHQIAARLGSDEWAALAALHDSPNPLVQHAFFARFGPIRAYRPWNPSAPLPDQPWHYPANASERLWYLGLLFPAPTTHPGGPPRLCLPAEFREAPALFVVHPFAPTTPTSLPAENHLPTAALATMFDLAVLLGLLHYDDIPPRQGRWLPVRFLTRWSQQLAQPIELPSVRSERQAPRLHFIHYLAETAGFLSCGRFIKPTPTASLWLQAPPTVRLATLWQTWWQPDLWQTYHLPASATPDALAFVRHLLDRLQTANSRDWQTIPALLQDLARPLHPEPVWWQDPTMAPVLPEALAHLVHGPLRWLGLAETNADVAVAETNATPTPTPPAELATRLTIAARQHQAGQPLSALSSRTPIPCTIDDHQVTFSVDTNPASLATIDLHHLFEILCLCGDQSLTPASLNLALERGETLEAIVRLLGDVRHQPLSAAEYAVLRGWALTPAPLTLRQLTVLEADTPERLTKAVARPTIRPFVRRTLGRRAVVVDFRQVPQLVTRLHRLGIGLHVLVPGLALDPDGAPRPTGESTSTQLSSPAHLLLAGLVYRQLSRFVGLPVTLPTAVLDELMTRLSPATVADVRALAEEVLNRVQQAFDGYSDPPLDNPFPAAVVLPALQRAIADSTSITFSYWTAGRGELTHRTVDPYRIETRYGVPYLVAYCHTRRAERVFRVDRIVEITAAPGGETESLDPQ